MQAHAELSFRRLRRLMRLTGGQSDIHVSEGRDSLRINHPRHRTRVSYNPILYPPSVKQAFLLSMPSDPVKEKFDAWLKEMWDNAGHAMNKDDRSAALMGFSRSAARLPKTGRVRPARVRPMTESACERENAYDLVSSAMDQAVCVLRATAISYVLDGNT